MFRAACTQPSSWDLGIYGWFALLGSACSPLLAWHTLIPAPGSGSSPQSQLGRFLSFPVSGMPLCSILLGPGIGFMDVSRSQARCLCSLPNPSLGLTFTECAASSRRKCSWGHRSHVGSSAPGLGGLGGCGTDTMKLVLSLPALTKAGPLQYAS